MTVSGTEAHAINCVIAYLAGRQGYDQSAPPLPSREQAVNALVTLARSADLRLHVGYDAEKARAALLTGWPQAPGNATTDELNRALEASSQTTEEPQEPEPAPHQVTVTHLSASVDLSDRRQYELLVADNATGGWVSHLVAHPDACHRLPYGTACWFDDEWENGQFSYEDIPPGQYTVRPGHQDVGGRCGEYSHTESFLTYQPITDPADAGQR